MRARNHSLAGLIQDAAWACFWEKVEHKAVIAAGLTRKVTPQYSTQNCNRCHAKRFVALSERTYHCPSCDYAGERDHDSSIIILQRALLMSGVKVRGRF